MSSDDTRAPTDAAEAWLRIEESELRFAGVTAGTGFGKAVGLEGLTLTDPGGLPVVWVDPSGQGTWGRFIALFGALERARTDLELRVARARCATTSASGTGSRTTTSPRPNAFRSVRASLVRGLSLTG